MIEGHHTDYMATDQKDNIPYTPTDEARLTNDYGGARPIPRLVWKYLYFMVTTEFVE